LAKRVSAHCAIYKTSVLVVSWPVNATSQEQTYIRWCCFDLSNAPRLPGTGKEPLQDATRQPRADKLSRWAF
jgi:hypothetical protein